MNEKGYKRRLEFQQKMILKQSRQIESLKSQNEKLKLELQEKNDVINSVALLKDELIRNIDDVKRYKEEYRELIKELRKMKETIDKDVYKGRWRLIKHLMK